MFDTKASMLMHLLVKEIVLASIYPRWNDQWKLTLIDIMSCREYSLQLPSKINILNRIKSKYNLRYGFLLKFFKINFAVVYKSSGNVFFINVFYPSYAIPKIYKTKLVNLKKTFHCFVL